MKIFEIIKQKFVQYIIFAFSFALCSVPKSSFAGALITAARNLKWEDGDCKLDKWESMPCLTCPLFKALYDAASELSLSAYNSLHAPLEAVVAVATAVWIAIKVIKYMASFEAIEPWKMIQEIGYQLFRCMVVILILHANYSSVRSLTLDPVLETGMNISQFFVGAQDCSKAGKVIANGGLSQGVGNSLLCSVYGVETQAFDVIGVGANGRCLAYTKNIGFGIDSLFVKFMLPNANYIITGYLLMIVGAIFLIGCPFLMVDSVVNMCFAVTLMPAGVACCAFKSTASHMKKIWNTFLEGAFHFVFMTLIIYVLSSSIANIMADVQESASAAGGGPKTFGNILHGLSFVGPNFLKLAFIFFLGWSVLGKAGELASTFAPGGLNPAKGIGADLGKQAAHAAKRAAGGAIAATSTALKATADATGLTAAAQRLRSKAANSIKSFARAPLEAAKFVKNSQTKKAIHGVVPEVLGRFGADIKETMANTRIGKSISDARARGQERREARQKDRQARRDERAKKIRKVTTTAAMIFATSKTGQAFFAAQDVAKKTGEAIKSGSQAFSDWSKDKIVAAKRLKRKYKLLTERKIDHAIFYTGTFLGHATNVAAIASLATPAGQVALGAYGAIKAGKAIAGSKAVKKIGVGYEFLKSATRIKLKDWDTELARHIGNVGVEDPLRQAHDPGNKLFSERVREDMMRRNSFDKQKQEIADGIIARQRERDAKTDDGKQILGERKQQHWDNMQNLHAQFEQRKAEMEERKKQQERQQHWDNAEAARQKRMELAARKKAQDDAVAAALAKKQHALNAQNLNAQFQERRAAWQDRQKLYGDVDQILNDPKLSEADKDAYMKIALGDEKRINEKLANAKKSQSERDLEGMMKTGLTKDEENLALDMAVNQEKAEQAAKTATLTPEEEAKIRADEGAKFDRELAQMKEMQAKEEAAARAAEEARLKQEQAEREAAEAKAKADEAERIAKEKAAEEAQKEYERQLKEWEAYQNANKNWAEKLFGVELSEEEIKRRQKYNATLAALQARWDAYENRQQQEREEQQRELEENQAAYNSGGEE